MTAIDTSLGYPIEAHGSTWVLDLTDLQLLHGLSVVSRGLSEEIVAQAKADRIDINVERTVSLRENPELLEDFGVALIQVCAEHESVRSIADHPDACEHHLRALLGNLQRRTYREALLPTDPATASRALVADFSVASTEMPNRFVMEFVRSSVDSRSGYLRITIEDPHGRRLDLGSIPHLAIEGIESRTFIAGSTRIAQTWADGLRRQAERGRRTFTEIRKPYSHLFQRFDKAGLGDLERVAIQWDDLTMPLILEGEPAELEHLMKRVLLALEDAGIWRHLSAGGLLRVDVGESSVYLDVSHLGRVLNLSLGHPRERTDVGGFLERMPALDAVVRRAAPPGAEPLANTSIFLVHHMTSEVLGLIAALRRLGCRDLTCLFVVYGGEAPPSYLEAVLDLPSDEFRALALVNVPVEREVEGRYRLSSQYSPLDERDTIEAALDRQAGDYLDAMRTASVPCFLSMVARAAQAGRSCIIVEDGGYLLPIVQEACLMNATVRAFAAGVGVETTDERLLADALQPILLGGVEHTRNGFDRLADVETRHGRLAFPAFSIAVSRLKRSDESREVTASILNAIETVLHAEGRVLSRRTCLVIGCRGAIGGHLMQALTHRLGAPEQLLGIDKVIDSADSGSEAARYADLPDDRQRRIDLVIGVAGTSVLSGDDVAAWLHHNPGRELVLASGSTKTVEFAAVAQWLNGLLRAPQSEVHGEAVEIRSQEIVDARTGRVYGHRYSFMPVAGSAARHLVFLANLTPVNFLFYGVPTELIDEVLAQLTTSTLGLLRRAGDLPARLHAVDREIDADGEAIDAPSPPA